MQSRLLMRAEAITGSGPALADALGVTEEALGLWRAGKARLPLDVFLAATDLVLEDDIARAAQDRRAEPRLFPAVKSRGIERPDAA